MNRPHPLLALVALAALAACSKPAQKAAENTAAPAPAAPAAGPIVPAAVDAPAGTYTLDKAHASLVFRVDHLGFSHYTASFTRFDAKLQLDPKNPAGAMLEATVDPKSLTLNNPPPGFTQALIGKDWLDAAQYPQMAFRSTAVELTGPNTAKVTGDFTLHGVTKPVTMDVTFNGGYPGMAALDPQARIGFSAQGVLKRSDFGISAGIPAPGTNMGVGDEVSFRIETEMLGPPLKG